MTKMAVIGAGMMGSAIISGIVHKNVVSADTIWVSDADLEKSRSLHEKLGTWTASSNSEAVSGADVVLLAVKPQFLDGVLNEIKGQLDPDCLLMTIVVGVSVARYMDALEHTRIVRIMPNTPAQVGEGACGWYASEDVTPEQKEFASSVLNALGYQCEVRQEFVLDQITAVSGSGPAYVYLFIEAMIDSAVQLGLPRPMAQALTLQTISGSVEYMKTKGAHPAVLRNEVTSPGGTTADALAIMEKEGFRSAVNDGMRACYKKTLKLGGR